MTPSPLGEMQLTIYGPCADLTLNVEELAENTICFIGNMDAEFSCLMERKRSMKL